MRRLAPWILALTLFATLGSKLDRLEDYERDHYFALRVYMDKKERKQYLRNKTPEARDQWLKDHGYWERFYKYDERRREAILNGEAAPGWSEDMIFMAWGRPFDRKRLTGRNASRSVLLVYRFEVAPDGAVLVWVPKSKTTHNAVEKYQLEVYVDDGKVREIKKKDGWE